MLTCVYSHPEFDLHIQNVTDGTYMYFLSKTPWKNTNQKNSGNVISQITAVWIL